MEKKKISKQQVKRLSTIDDSIRLFTERSIDGLVNQFAPLRKSISPLVDKLQVHLDMFPEKKKMNARLWNRVF